MAKINYSGLVDSISGKLNGSTLRMQSGQGIIQNKPYRNPIGMRGIAQITNFIGLGKVTFWNQGYHQAVQDVAHNGNPFSDSVSVIRDTIRNWGWVDVADNGTDTAAIATALTPWFLFPIGIPPTLNPAMTIPDPAPFTITLQQVGSDVALSISRGLAAANLTFLLDLSPPSSIVNYRLRQRVLVRLTQRFDSSGNYAFLIPAANLPISIVTGEYVWAALTLVNDSGGAGFGPRSARIITQVL